MVLNASYFTNFVINVSPDNQQIDIDNLQEKCNVSISL